MKGIRARLLVAGAPVQTQTSMRDIRYVLRAFDVRGLQGKQAQLEVLAQAGEMGIGRVTFSDTPGDGTPAGQWPDYGSMSLALLGAPRRWGSPTGKSVSTDNLPARPPCHCPNR